MPNVPLNIIKSYLQAKKWISVNFGRNREPSDFKIYFSNHLFPVLLRSEAMRLAGSPSGLFSASEELAIHRISELWKRSSFAHHFLAQPNRGYFYGSETEAISYNTKDYASQFVRLLAAFSLGENSLREISAKNERLNQIDRTLHSLLTRAISRSPASNRNWVCQYFQDVAAFVARFSVMENHVFHEPSQLEESPYAEFLRQLIPYARRRAQLWRSIPLHKALVHGFLFVCAKEFNRETKSDFLLSGGALGKIIGEVLLNEFASFKNILENFDLFISDKQLMESIQPEKFYHFAERVPLSPGSKEVVTYLRGINEFSLDTNGDMVNCGFQSDRYLGYLESKWGPIYFYEFDKTQLVPEQLLILHNHAKPLDDQYCLPGIASIVTFRATKNGNYLGSIFRPNISVMMRNPQNPWDFPYNFNSAIPSIEDEIENSEWNEFLRGTWISKQDLKQIGLNDRQLECAWVLLKGKALL